MSEKISLDSSENKDNIFCLIIKYYLLCTIFTNILNRCVV